MWMAKRADRSLKLRRLVLDAAGAAHQRLGPSPSVDQMEKQFVDEVVSRRVQVTRRSDTVLSFGGRPVQTFLADVVLEGRLMVEFKRLPTITSVDLYRFARFLETSHLREGFLVNVSASGLDCRYMNVSGN